METVNREYEVYSYQDIFGVVNVFIFNLVPC